jgi:crotonobetainyl-CoA:carnitine CoA-transferase CaiB-like acyl-CoA transferase
VTNADAQAGPNGLPIQTMGGDSGQGFSHLSGTVVVDLTTSVAGPYATMLLADFGATVIKIERVGGGDDARHWGPPFLDGESLWFLAINRNKKSVALDITTAEGYAVLTDLVARADVVVTNQPANIQAKLKTDFDSLASLNDRLIHASITGFGLTGHRAAWTCYDLIAEGYSGVMDLTGAADSAPQKIGTPAADMLAGQDAAMTVMAALLNRDNQDGPQQIDIALVESMTRFLTCRITPYLGSGEVPRRSGGTDSVIAIYQAFETADDPITLGLGTDGIFRRFWKAVGNPDYAENPDFKNNAERRRHRARIVAEIQDVLFDKTAAEWLEIFAAARVPAGPINSVADVSADPHLQDRGLIFTLTDGSRQVPQVGLGIHVNGEAATPRSLPPSIGADTDAVLNEFLGFDAGRIAALRGSNTIS